MPHFFSAQRPLGLTALYFVLFFCSFFTAVADEKQQTSVDTLESLDALFAEIDALLGESPEGGDYFEPSSWAWYGTASASVGYEENVLLAARQPQASAYVRPSLDAMVTYRTEAQEWVAFAFYEGRRFEEREIDDEHLALAHTKWTRFYGDVFGGISADYLFAKQVFDASGSTTTVIPGWLRQQVAAGSFFLGQTVGPWKSEFSILAERAFFDRRRDDYWRGGVRLKMGYDAGEGVRWDVFAEAKEAWYLEGPARDAIGLPRFGERLRLRQLRVGAEVRWTPDAQRRWQFRALGAVAEEWEAVGSFYGRTRAEGLVSVRWKAGPWQVLGEGQVVHLNYTARQVNPVNRDAQWQTRRGGVLALERTFGKQWEVGLRGFWTRLESNVARLTYDNGGGEFFLRRHF